MAPAVVRGRGKNQDQTAAEAPELPANPEQKQSFAILRGLREHLKANADDVGEKFPDEARKIHYGEAEARDIYGEATSDEATSLNKEGIPVLPLPKLPEEHD